MNRFTAVLDACVLYPAPLRDLLVSLAAEGLFRAKWTDDIHDEWMRNVVENRPELAGKLDRTRRLMDAAIPDCLVAGYGDLIDSLTLPDPNDRHVLAAAIAARADVIVTHNLKDFPASELGKYAVEVVTPDDFVLSQIGLAPQAACVAIRKQRARLRNPPVTVDGLLDTFSKQGLLNTVGELRKHAHLL